MGGLTIVVGCLGVISIQFWFDMFDTRARLILWVWAWVLLWMWVCVLLLQLRCTWF